MTFKSVRLKRFRRTAPNQELLLQTFEELQWHKFVDDPLCPVDGIITQQRLRNTVKNLNRTISPKLIQFSTDGTGTRVLWRDVSPGAK